MDDVLCCRNTLPVEYLSGKPLCMDQYYQILSSCRIPGTKRDTVVNHAMGKTPPTHITVVHNFQVLYIDGTAVFLILRHWVREMFIHFSTCSVKSNTNRLQIMQITSITVVVVV